MLRVTIDEIQRDPSKYLRQVEAGETFVIIQANKAIAELRPISSKKELRPFGLCAGKFTVPDDFDAPLPEDILSAAADPHTSGELMFDQKFGIQAPSFNDTNY